MPKEAPASGKILASSIDQESLNKAILACLAQLFPELLVQLRDAIFYEIDALRNQTSDAIQYYDGIHDDHKRLQKDTSDNLVALIKQD